MLAWRRRWGLRRGQVRFQSLTDKSVLEAEPELFIHLQPDKTNGTLTIRDSGVGMTKADLVNNLGAPPVVDRKATGAGMTEADLVNNLGA